MKGMMKFLIVFLISNSLFSGNDLFYRRIGASALCGCREFNYDPHFEAVGDINGDGYMDLIGKSEVFNAYISYIWIIYGSSERLPEELSMCDYTGKMTKLYGGGNFSSEIGLGAGDFNGDGYDDVVVGNLWVGAHPATQNTYIVYGRPDMPEEIDFLNLPSNLKVSRIMTNPDPYYYYDIGERISTGDLNGDGYDDLILSEVADPPDERGTLYIFYGSSSGLPSFIDIKEPPANTTSILGIYNAFLYDVNKDGKGDLIAGYKWDGFNGEREGAGLVLILYNSQSGFPESINISNPPENSTIIYGAKKGDSTGSRVLVYDLDRDSYNDLIISADSSDSEDGKIKGVGKLWILYGSLQGLPKIIDLLNPPEQFTVIYGAEKYDQIGYGEIEIGDINNDGKMDIIASNPAWGEHSNGKIWIIYGNGKRFPKVVDLAKLPEDIKVYTIEGKEVDNHFGYYKLKILDFDKDGLNDFIFYSASSICSYYGEINIFYYSLFKLKN